MTEKYDVVIIGGGPNGLGIAAYLSKSGLKVCLCEERLEVGGGGENTEPIPGFRIDPHATYLYGAAAPGFEQLELHKYGFRMVHFKNIGGGVTSDGKAIAFGIFNPEETLKSLKRYSDRDAQIWTLFHEKLFPNLVEFLRSIYWTPPPPSGVEVEQKDYPWSQVLKKCLPEIYDDSWNALSTFELLDALFETEALKVSFGMGSWYNGPHPSWRGTAINGFACNLLAMYSSGSPRGGMHSYMHALARCAIANGTRIITNSRVAEIIVVDGEAKGVKLEDTSPLGNRTIWADKAVISAVHVKNTFLDLMPKRHLEQSFVQKVKDINLNGGSLFVLSLITKELPQYKGEAKDIISGANYPSCVFIPVDSREPMINQMKDVYSFKTHPAKKESMIIPVCVHDIFDETRSPEGYHVLSPIYLQVPPPEYHRDGPLAVNNAKEEISNLLIETLRSVAPNMTDDKIVAKFVNTPYDSSFRNMAFVGGNWYGIRECEDQWWNLRPLPELARYRTPVQKLYLCNHTSYPGGLCLMAVPYNLMHILIEDKVVQPGKWWYPSPWYIAERR
ncbi:MAG TPA: NAD(P)/FAD-dependent oxidoreductase [bacterium]